MRHLFEYYRNCTSFPWIFTISLIMQDTRIFLWIAIYRLCRKVNYSWVNLLARPKKEKTTLSQVISCLHEKRNIGSTIEFITFWYLIRLRRWHWDTNQSPIILIPLPKTKERLHMTCDNCYQKTVKMSLAVVHKSWHI